MSKKNTGGPAFPDDRFAVSGMTLRDYFAAQAMNAFFGGLLAAAVKDPSCLLTPDYSALMADGCYSAADAMLKAREA